MKKACELIGANRSTIQRRRRPPVLGPPTPRPEPPNKLTEAERQHILSVLRSEAFCDLAPAQVWAQLLDDGIYLCSIRTMYRLLAIAGENRERRRQRTHPARTKPELIARAPNQVCMIVGVGDPILFDVVREIGVAFVTGGVIGGALLLVEERRESARDARDAMIEAMYPVHERIVRRLTEEGRL